MSESVEAQPGNGSDRSLLSLALGATALVSAAVSVAGFISLEAGARKLGLASALSYSVDAIANSGIIFWISSVASLPLAFFSVPGAILLASAILAAVTWFVLNNLVSRSDSGARWVGWARHFPSLAATCTAAIVLVTVGYICIGSIIVAPAVNGILFEATAESHGDGVLLYAAKLGWALLGAASLIAAALLVRVASRPWPSLIKRVSDLVFGTGFVTLFFALAAAFGSLRGTDVFHQVTSLEMKADRHGVQSGEQHGVFLLSADKDLVVLYDATQKRVIWLPRDGIVVIRLGGRATPQ